VTDNPVLSGSGETRLLRPDYGSFRDRNNRVYDDGSSIVRGISEEAYRNWVRLSQQPFFHELIAEGKLVETDTFQAADIEASGVNENWHAYLTHHRIPFITYPYEWSFGMLRDAALLHLNIFERALSAGWGLKDATAYNVQWVGARPVFIDIPSFEPYEKGASWTGYRQFCMMFLYPLMLRAYSRIDYRPFLRGDLEGIDPQTANRILSGFTRLRKGVLGHVYFHSKMDRKFAEKDRNQAKALTEDSDQKPTRHAAFKQTPTMILATIDGLRRIVEKLRTPDARTAWGDYDTDHSYSDGSFAAKKEFVESCIQARQRRMVWDLGCNTGTFSRIAARKADYVVAIDGDTKAVERLYQDLKSTGPTNILPLAIDLSNASPNQGWRGRERKAIEQRGKPELILCLALIHHIVISANIPVAEFIDWLREFDAEVVLEWIGPQDDLLQMLLRGRVNQYDDLSAEKFEMIIAERFEIRRTEVLKGGSRKIYHLIPQ
jgi:hypothetical protein